MNIVLMNSLNEHCLNEQCLNELCPLSHALCPGVNISRRLDGSYYFQFQGQVVKKRNSSFIKNFFICFHSYARTYVDI